MEMLDRMIDSLNKGYKVHHMWDDKKKKWYKDVTYPDSAFFYNLIDVAYDNELEWGDGLKYILEGKRHRHKEKGRILPDRTLFIGLGRHGKPEHMKRIPISGFNWNRDNLWTSEHRETKLPFHVPFSYKEKTVTDRGYELDLAKNPWIAWHNAAVAAVEWYKS